MRTESVLTVARGLGLEVQPPRGSSGGAFPCPACNAPRRHTKTRDKRAAVGVRRDGHGWHCFQCEAGGDAIDLVAFHLRGDRLSKLSDAGKAEVRDWCMRWLSLDRTAPVPWPSQRTRPIESEAPEPPSYPPADEVKALWAASQRVVDDDLVATWLSNQRRLDPDFIANMDLARTLPATATPLPQWAGFGGERDKPWRSWASVGLRLVVPLFDVNGSMRSVLFRRAFETDGDWPPKSMATRGCQRAGLVMANAAARELLAHPPQRATGMSIVIEEGETDWLTGCMLWARSNERAIFGVVSGAWTDQFALRIPRGARVTIRTDNDTEGDRLASKIAKTLLGRCTVLRGGVKAVSN